MTESKNVRSDSSRQAKSVSRSTFLFIIALVAVVGFVAGTREREIMAFVAPLLGMNIETGELDLSSTQRVYQQLKANYDGELDQQALINGAARGMVAAAGDPYTVYMDAEETAEFNNELGGRISGIGAEIGVRNERPTILRTIPGSPAERAGLKRSDQIIAVNNEATIDYDAAKTAERIRGESGTTVKLVIMRDKSQEEFTITRAQVSDTSVDSRLEGSVGVLNIRRFDSDTGSLARQQASQLLDRGATSIVLDMRDNGGGYLDQAQAVAGLWLDDKTVVIEKRGEEVVDTLQSTGAEPILADIPTAVLVNGSSASASEIVAGALKDHDKAKLVGETTFGKGSVQKVLQLGSGQQLKVTIARWYTPSGATIAEKGIEPDTEVELTLEQLNNDQDPQLEAALAELAK